MPTPNENALNLILRGFRYQSDPEEMEKKRQLVREYFGSITIQDLNGAIAEFEHSADPGERWAAAQALIAYFRWCWMNGRTQVGATNLNDVVLWASGRAVLHGGVDQLSDGGHGEGLRSASEITFALLAE